MPESVTLLPSTTGLVNVVGEAVAADGWHGHVDGLHTVAFYLQNFKGRVLLQGTIALEPQEQDWFPIYLSTTPHLEFPKQPAAPTGQFSGDTGVEMVTFRANVVWLRVIVDRSYLPDPVHDAEHIGQLGVLRKVVLAR